MSAPTPEDRHARERAAREAKWAAMTDEDILRLCIEQSRSDVDPVTRAFLATTVPLWIEIMRPWPAHRREHKARELGQIIAYGPGAAALADPDRRGSTRSGALGSAFNALAQGLACLAFCPGGVVFAGRHWEVRP